MSPYVCLYLLDMCNQIKRSLSSLCPPTPNKVITNGKTCQLTYGLLLFLDTASQYAQIYFCSLDKVEHEVLPQVVYSCSRARNAEFGYRVVYSYLISEGAQVYISNVTYMHYFQVVPYVHKTFFK